MALRDYEHNHEDNGSESYTNANAARNQVEHFDLEETASSTSLLKLFLSQLNMVAVYELVSWSLIASKSEIADLTRTVIRAAQCGNQVARIVIEEATNEIADDIIYLINKVCLFN